MKQIRSYILSIAIITLFVLICFWWHQPPTSKPTLNQQFHKAAKFGMGIGTPKDKFARFTYEYGMLVDPATGKIPPYMRQKELAFAKTLPKAKYAKNDWVFKSRGPYNVGGRTRAFAIDVRNEAILFAGSVSGGLWKSVDAGESWYKVTGADQNLSITTIVQDIRAGRENEWYIGTGEFFGASQSGRGAFYYGNGIFKSTDNGETWQLLPNTATNNPQSFTSEWQGIWRLAIDYSNTEVTEIYAASYARIHRSVDGGDTWNVVFGTGLNDEVSYFTDIAITSEGVVYVSLSKENDIIANGLGEKGGIWRSETGTGDFINILPENFPPAYNRIALGIAPSDENQIYFALANVDSLYGKRASTPTQGDEFNGLWKYVYKSGDGSGEGGAWTDLTGNLYRGPNQFDDFYVQGGYDLMVAVKPDDPNVVFIGGTNLFRSTDGFSTADNITHIGGYSINAALPLVDEYPNHHPDQHGVFFSYANPDVMFSYHDGGLSKTSNCLAEEVDWCTVNKGYLSSQFYTLAIDDDTSNKLMGGLQDNGTYFTNKNDSLTSWTKPYGADGGYCAFVKRKDEIIVSTQLGRLIKVKIDEDGNPLQYQRFDPALPRDTFAFINAFTLDPETSNTLYMPIANKLWIRDQLNEIPFENNFDSTSVGWTIYPDTLRQDGRVFTRITPAKANPFFRMYLGTNTSHVYRIDKINNLESTTFINVTSPDFPVNAFVSDIAVNPHNGNKVMVCFSNHNVYSIYYSEDGGESWDKVAGNLEQFSNGNGNGPSVRVVDILANANRTYEYFAGTSIGLFHTTELQSDSTEWVQLASNTISNNIVSAIESREADGYVAVATHGNGVFSANTPKDIISVDEPDFFYRVKAFPNPASDALYISYTLADAHSADIQIYNELGMPVPGLSEKIQNRKDAQLQFNVSNLASGIYYYELRAGNRKKVKAFVVM